ncbi:MAG: VWA domain-containing protein, partial [Planctomycetota bacterium]
LALGRPLLEGAGLLGASGRDVYLLIDNGVASSLRDSEGNAALDNHKDRARAILDALNPGDRAGLIALGAPADPVVLPASSDLSAIGRLVDELRPTDGATDLQGALASLAAHAGSLENDEAERPTVAAIVSDFRAGSADLTRPLAQDLEGLDNVRLLAIEPTERLAGNTQIVGIDPLRSVVLTGAGRAAEDVSVRVRLARTGSAVSEPGVTTVRLSAVEPGQEPGAGDASRATVRWTPGQSEASVTMTVTLDRQDIAGEEGVGASVLVGTIDRDALDSDNTLRTPVRITDALEVGVVGARRFTGGATIADRSAADWLRPALAPTESTPVRLVDLEPGALDDASLIGLDALVLPQPDLVPDESWPALRAFSDAGGLLIVTPPSDTTVHLWTDPFVRAFDLGWSFPRESTDAPDDAVFSIQPDDAGPNASTGTLLSLLRDELEPLLRPVGVFRVLAPDLSENLGTARILTLDSGEPWLIATRAGDPGGNPDGISRRGSDVDNRAPRAGVVVYIASAPTLDWTDLPARPLMVPLMQELIRQGVGASGADPESLAGQPAQLPRGAVTITSTDDTGRERAIDVDIAGVTSLPVRGAGVWEARDRAGRTRSLLAVNTDTRAARTDLNPPDALRAWLLASMGEGADERVAWLDDEAPGDALASSDDASPLSLPLLIAALALALLETLLARWFAHAWRDPGLP